MSERRSVWNVVALIATLALSTVVAVVAVTRSGKEAPRPAQSPSASPSPTGTTTAGTLDGAGPYVLYATGAGVFAYDIASGSTTSLGGLDGTPASQRSRQPGGGRVVAFTTGQGSVWSVKRHGMKHVLTLPSSMGTSFEGAAVSLDDRRIAIAALTPEPKTVVLDLSGGRPRAVGRQRRGQYPTEPLLPVAWGLGGTVLYQVPFCRCAQPAPGLYSLDVSSGSSTVVTGTRTSTFDEFVVSASGQALFFGAGTSRRCRTGERASCDRAPYFLRRLAAGQRGTETIRRANDDRFVPTAISAEGRTILVARGSPGAAGTRTELYGSDGNRLSSIRGIPDGARAVALLPGDIVIATTSSPSAVLVIRAGRPETIIRTESQDAPVYLGWLR